MKAVISSLLLVVLAGCSTTPVNTVNWTAPSPVQLGHRTMIDLGHWLEITLRVKLLNKHFANASELVKDRQTGFEFSINGVANRFDIEDIEFTIETATDRITIRGLGTGEAIARDSSGNTVEVGFEELEKTGDPYNDELNRFILVVPIDLSRDSKFIKLTGRDLYDDDVQFEMKWSFV